MPSEMMNTKEVAEHLGINEKQVYALIKERGIPCTRVTGKWLFPRHLIDAWIDDNARSGCTRSAGAPGRRHLLAAGSNDPVLDVLLNRMKQGGGRYLFSCSTGSARGLEMLAGGSADIAWCHLHDSETGTYNIAQATTALEGKRIAVVHLFYREIGFVARQAEGPGVRSFSDLTEPGVTFVNRQAGSGTRLFIDQRLAAEGISPESVRGYDREVYTHLEVALAVLSGDAVTGIASVAAATMMGLHFSPLARESFDMVLLQETFFSREIQDFIAALQSDEFKRQVAPMGNYDFGESGRILYSN
jgi:putative molybdopterin biosynthesis protein